jgi:homoserine O-acetyltransferase
MDESLPVTGAWRPGDAPGSRRFIALARDRPFALEGGGRLRDIDVAYETWGSLSDAADNAVLVCHALTGDSHAAGDIGAGHPTPGWWDGLIGPGQALDSDRLFVVCVNVLGGCQGTTGPASPAPESGRPYGSSFPVVTVRDMVRIQAAVATRLGVDRWLCVIGGSLGGMQVVEWGVTFPDRVQSLVPIATTARATAQQIAFGKVGRDAIRLDPRWRGGDYYDAPPGEGPYEGLRLAREIAQITYRTDDVFTNRFGRERVDPHVEEFTLWDRFQVESYLDYHGAKLARRFDANSYLLLSKAMDLHDVARGRGDVSAALARISVPVLAIGIRSDTLYWPAQQRELVDRLQAAGTPAEYREIDSPHGHDAFLIDIDQVADAVSPFLARVEKAET